MMCIYSVMELKHKTFWLVLYVHQMKKSVGGTNLKYSVIMLIVSFLKMNPWDLHVGPS